MNKTISFLVFIFCLYLSSCNQNREAKINSEFFELNTIAELLEYDLRLLENEIVALGVYTAELLQNKETKTKPRQSFNFVIEGFSANSEPGANPNYSTIYFSTLILNPTAVRDMVLITNPLDEKFKEIIQKYPTVSQVYFSSDLQINRLFPPYDVNSTLESDLDLTSFNFYKEADQFNNPSKGIVWIDELYIDPVGRGWMITVTYPVYVDNELKMVLGFDITLNQIIENYLNKSSAELVIIDGKGSMVAGKSKAIEALALPSLKNYTYNQTVTSDSFRKEEFNLFKSKDINVRVIADKIINGGEEIQWLPENNHNLKILSKKLNKMDWYILEIQF